MVTRYTASSSGGGGGSDHSEGVDIPENQRLTFNSDVDNDDYIVKNPVTGDLELFKAGVIQAGW